MASIDKINKYVQEVKELINEIPQVANWQIVPNGPNTYDLYICTETGRIGPLEIVYAHYTTSP